MAEEVKMVRMLKTISSSHMTCELADWVQFQVTGIMQPFEASFKGGGVAVFTRALAEKAASQIWVLKGCNREGTSVLAKKLWDSPECDFRGWE